MCLALELTKTVFVGLNTDATGVSVQTFLNHYNREEADYTFRLRLETVSHEWLDSDVDPEPLSWHYQSDGAQIELFFRKPYVPGRWTHHFRLDLARGEGLLRLANPTGRRVFDYKELFPAFLDRFLFMEMLNYLGDGCFIHSASLLDAGQGILLVGQSGAGKSTSSRLWQKFGGPGVTCLTDEYSLVRRRATGELWVYGTPWPSSAGIANRGGGPLNRIYCLKHAPSNEAVPLDRQTALIRLLSQGQLSFWNSTGVGTGVDTLLALSDEIPIFELGFLPDSSVIEYVRNHLSAIPLISIA